MEIKIPVRFSDNFGDPINYLIQQLVLIKQQGPAELIFDFTDSKFVSPFFIGSIASLLCIETPNTYPVGIEINANHLRSVKEGVITAITRPIHLGRSTQVWQIDLFDQAGRQTCVSRMTAAVLSR